MNNASKQGCRRARRGKRAGLLALGLMLGLLLQACSGGGAAASGAASAARGGSSGSSSSGSSSSSSSSGSGTGTGSSSSSSSGGAIGGSSSGSSSSSSGGGVTGGSSSGGSSSSSGSGSSSSSGAGFGTANSAAAAWGDSATSGIGAPDGQSYPDQLQALIGRPVFNGGVSGQTSDQIAARQGGAPALLTLPNNQIPASGPVTAQTASTYPITPDGPGPITGTLGGVHGSLDLYVDSSNNWFLVFTRDAAGSAVSVPPQSPFHPDTFGREKLINVLWIGNNNFYQPDQVQSDLQHCVAFLTTDHYVVLGMINAAYEPKGTWAHDAKVALNTQLAQDFPGHFIDIRTILINHYNPNDPQDVQDYNNDVIPTSLRNDDEHPNEAGYAIVAQQVAAMIQANGW